MVDKMEGVTSSGAPGSLDPSKYPVPIETIYVNRLAEWVPIPEMKIALTKTFQQFGPILDIIIKSSLKRKGQAFVVFDGEKVQLEHPVIMDGFPLYGQKIHVQKAKTHSDETVRRKAPEMFEEHKRKRLTLKDMKRVEEDKKAQANPTAAADKPRAVKTGAALIPDEYVRPNKTLFLQGVPKEMDEDALTAIFERFEGFKEVRAVSVKAVAFAEFESEQYAIVAKEATANMPVGSEGKQLKVSYQRQQ